MEAAGAAAMGKDTLAHRFNPAVITDPEKCSGCGRCISACPEKLFSLELNNRRKYSLIKTPDNCALCGKCILACPLGIIQ